MSTQLEEVTMALTPLVKRDHPRWTMTRCKREAEKQAKIFMKSRSKRMDWSKVEQCDTTSKPLQAF